MEKVNGKLQWMEEYKDKSLIIVNTASKCGFASQFKVLQELHEEYKDRGLDSHPTTSITKDLMRLKRRWVL